MTTPVYLGELLLRKGLITPEQLHHALAKQKETHEFLGEIMVREQYLTEKEMKAALAEQLGLAFVEPAEMELAPEVIESVSPQQALRYRVAPVEKTRDSITVACANPMALSLLDKLKYEIGGTVKVAVTTEEQIDRALEKNYHERLHNVSAILEDLSEKDLKNLAIEYGSEITDLDAMRTLANEAPIIRLVNFFLSEGVRLGASDIHLEPFENEVKLRYRIDGILYERNPPPRNLYPALISRIKLMAGMDITEKRLPQDGRIRLRLAVQDLDLRVAVAPTLHGEEVVIRILNRLNLLMDLNELGMESILGRFESLINLSHGMILVTGPTGSGKTTTLYAVLSRLNQPERKIITIEDPIEYELIGINQIPVSPKLNFGFPQALRTIVRHDPDVILVGEIRDQETAEMAVQSALTGHLVFSTLHTNDAATAFTRLVDMKVEEYLVASTVRGILAQRLARRICPYCRVEYQPTLKEEKILAKLASPPSAFYHGLGCERCNNIGYRGQIGLFELLLTSPALETMVMKRANSSQIQACAVEEGMETLRKDGWKKVRAGLTTIAELLRVT